MPISTATVTAPIGPGLTATALVFTNPRSVEIDGLVQALRITNSIGKVSNFDLHATTTITATAAAGVFTVTVSQ